AQHVERSYVTSRPAIRAVGTWSDRSSACLLPELLEERRGFRVRFGIQLSMESQAQLPVGLKDDGKVPPGGERLHQGSLRALPHRAPRRPASPAPPDTPVRGPAAPGTPTPPSSPPAAGPGRAPPLPLVTGDRRNPLRYRRQAGR